MLIDENGAVTGEFKLATGRVYFVADVTTVPEGAEITYSIKADGDDTATEIEPQDGKVLEIVSEADDAEDAAAILNGITLTVSAAKDGYTTTVKTLTFKESEVIDMLNWDDDE